MPQALILAGTIIASSIGCTLVALLLRSAIRSGRQISRDEGGFERNLPDMRYITVACDWENMVRGYDTPELCREDLLARSVVTGNAHLLQ